MEDYNQFITDLELVQNKYESEGRFLIDCCSKLVDELKYSTNEDRDEIVSYLQDNEKHITEWNKSVDTFINKYSNNKDYIRQFEKYLILPQR